MEIPKWLWWKKYFDTGYGLTGYFKLVVAVFAYYGWRTNLPPEYAFYLLIFYAIACFFIGYWWVTKIIEAENELNNQINPFQREVRKKLK